MRKIILLVALLALCGVPLLAQNQQVTGTLTASDSGACSTANACLVLKLNSNSGATIVQLAGTFSATVQFEGTADGANWVAVNGNPVGGTVAVQSATTAGGWQVNVAGMVAVRIRASTYASGTVQAVITSSVASAAARGGSGGGGSGTVNSGLAHQPAFYPANGTAVSGTCTVPATNGQFPMLFNVTADAAVDPSCPQSGFLNTAITGAATSYPITSANNLQGIEHDVAATQSVTYSLPTPTTLENTQFAIPQICNYSTHTDTLTPVTWTINGSASVTIPTNTCRSLSTDPFNATNWLSNAGGAPSGPAGGALGGTYPNPGLATSYNLPGTFTGTQYNSGFVFSLNTCDPSATGLESAPFTTDAFAGCVVVPSSGVTNGFSNGLAGFALNTNACTTCSGYGGPAGAVGVYGNAQATASNAHVWGFDSTVSAGSGNSNNVEVGYEDDVYVNSTSTTARGIYIEARGTAQATGDAFPGVLLGAASASHAFTSGFKCGSGSLAISVNNGCLSAGTQNASGASDAQSINAHANDGSPFSALFELLRDHSWYLDGGINSTYQATMLTATATIGLHQLVKIDTAHADSVVLCTTSDTTCDGFSAEKGIATYCAAAQTICPIIAGSGSKAIGILGTGTCSIGDYVIVDTTTNGDIQCTGTPPALHAEIGRALSAQSTVGQTVDILTRFE